MQIGTLPSFETYIHGLALTEIDGKKIYYVDCVR
jgi:hypothetical protein